MSYDANLLIGDRAGKRENVSNTKSPTKEEITHELIGKEGLKTNMLVVAGEMFSRYDKEFYESNQTIKRSMKSLLVMKTFNLVK